VALKFFRDYLRLRPNDLKTRDFVAKIKEQLGPQAEPGRVSVPQTQTQAPPPKAVQQVAKDESGPKKIVQKKSWEKIAPEGKPMPKNTTVREWDLDNDKKTDTWVTMDTQGVIWRKQSDSDGDGKPDKDIPLH
jgi:hypothetical protein